MNDPRNVTIDSGSKQVTVSKILDWFKPDFIGWYNREFNVDDARILDYVALYVGTAGATGFDRAWEVRYHNYDWALNDQQ